MNDRDLLDGFLQIPFRYEQNDPCHCVYCGQKCKREIFAGPATGKGDYGQMDCQNCGYNIVFKTQDLESLEKSKMEAVKKQ